MEVLTVPNWSFCDERTIDRFRAVIRAAGLDLHFLAGDGDHGRTVAAFRGPVDVVFVALEELLREASALPGLEGHGGVHPFIGMLDVCPFVARVPSEEAMLLPLVDAFADAVAEEFEIPVFMYERSEKGRHESDLPSLRRGGFAGLRDRSLEPDFGPRRAHPKLGVTVMGVRPFLIAMNVEFRGDGLEQVREIARDIRHLRAEGDERFLGVRALGLPLKSRGAVQVSLNLTLPDLTPADPIIQWVVHRADRLGLMFARTELIGVIRPSDVVRATRLEIDPRQIVPDVS